MATASEEILARSAKREKEADAFGRIITVQKLSPSKEVKVYEFTDSKSEVVVGPLMVAASVVAIDDRAFTFPRSRAELDAAMDALSNEGLTAAVKAMARLQEGDGKSPEEAAKN